MFYGPGKLRTDRALLDTTNPRTTRNRLPDWDPFGMHNRDCLGTAQEPHGHTQQQEEEETCYC